MITFSDLRDEQSYYSCGEYIGNHDPKNGRFCSRITLEDLSSDDSGKILEVLNGGKEDVIADYHGNFTFCRCHGHLCNTKMESIIKCYSTGVIGIAGLFQEGRIFLKFYIYFSR